MKTIYRNSGSKDEVIKLYDAQLARLETDFKDRYVKTSYGMTHIVETGNPDGKPLLLFHGGNSTTSYNLLLCRFLLDDFHIFAVDIIGHPGKSDENTLSAFGYDYGKWAGEVIDKLGFEKILCFGGSFGGGVLAKLMCIYPEKIEKSVLLVPSAISNAVPVSTVKMLVPLCRYRMTKNDEYISRTASYMAPTPDAIDDDTLKTLKNIFDNVKIKASMPSNVKAYLFGRCTSPVLVMAGQKDCLFPAKKVLKRAAKVLPNCKTYELKYRGHMHLLSDEEKEMIIDFLIK